MKNRFLPCVVSELGRVGYIASLELQEELVEARIRGMIPDSLLLLEHPPVYTTGRLGYNDNLLVSEGELREKGISLCRVNRGGNITFHGPGQLVGYPILNLKDHSQDVFRYLRQLERLLIDTLKEWGIRAYQVPGKTGVWTEGKKIASIGVGIKRWVSFHGFALNINTDLDYFRWINPCGLDGREITSMSQLKPQEMSIWQISQTLIQVFSRLFALDCQKKGLDSLKEMIAHGQKARMASGQAT
jgi:lipoate-protein ligase B